MSGFFSLFGILFVVFALFLFNIITSIWAYRDAKHNGKSNEYAVLILIGTLFFPLLA